MIRNAFIVVAIACTAACAQAQKPEPLALGDTEQVTATIQAVSQSDRHIVLLGEDGSRLLIEAGPDVRNFNQVKPGDRVVVTYHEGIIAEVKPKGEGVQGVKETTAQARSKPGEMPAEAVGSTIVTTVKIESVDNSFDTVTFRRPDGIVRTLAVEDPEAKDFIEKLRPGDEVQITYREASAVSIEPSRG